MSPRAFSHASVFRTSARVAVVLLLLFVPLAFGQQALEDAKRAYFEGRFEESTRMLEPLLGSLSDADALRDAAFFLGLNQLALDNEARGRSYFESAVRHDPSFQPSEDLFNPQVVSVYRSVRAGMVGRLAIDSSPSGAAVFVAGQQMGMTPYNIDAVAGDVTIRLELEGHAPEERRATVRAGEDTSVTVEMTASAESSSSSSTGGSAASEGGGGGMSGTTIGILAAAGGGGALALVAASGGDDGGTTTTTGGGGGTTTTPASAGVFSATVQPNPISVTSSGDPNFPFRIDFNVNISESAGLGGNVDFVNVTLRDTSTGGTTSAVNFGAGDIISGAGTNRVEARSSLQAPLAVRYRFGSGRSAGSLTCDIQVTDDRGNRQRITANATFR